ncbi:MAG TPA: hypothetical protein VGQ83_25030, partial [Polyangia bacterium]
TPASPALGDPLTLTLTVAAQPGVKVTPPPFGEALGRFSIVSFTPRARTTPAGGSVAVQTYALQAPMSGRQRIPPLRVEFVDERPGAADGGPARVRELLTEELTLEVKSILPAGAAMGQLHPPRGRLPVSAAGRALSRFWPALAAVLLAGLAVIAFFVWRRRAEVRTRLTAHDVARARLARLEGRGLPGPAEADAWYVELSDIVRRYLEDRYGVRAPELTTEEFLREARALAALTDSDRALLSRFLEGCDRVKFAGYRPDDAESRAALETARRLIDQTRAAAPGDAGRDADGAAAAAPAAGG